MADSVSVLSPENILDLLFTCKAAALIVASPAILCVRGSKLLVACCGRQLL